MVRFARAVIFALLASAPVVAADETAPVDYLEQVKPILRLHCYSCHGGLKQRGGLRVDTAASLLEGGERGPAVRPREPERSLVILAVTGRADFERMPFEGEPLSQEEVAVLRSWIAQGARAPSEAPPDDPRQHWAFRRPERPAIPAGSEGWVRNPIDAFVAREHRRLGLVPLPEADRRTLVRRLYLDLIGLPPAPSEVESFVSDDSPDAYERLVDQLLASPRHGERWGRHWMDVWRYSDWYGYQKELRNSTRHIWRWRDWIVASLNSGKGYDRMVIEMLAADEVAPTDPAALAATGFLARNYYKFNRNVWLDDAVEHTTKAFLGITLNCARCHDHMYDPIAQEEYYHFRAFFEPYRVRTDSVAGESDTQKDGVSRAYDADLEAPTHVFVRGDDKQPKKEKPLAARWPEILGPQTTSIEPVSLPPAAYYPALEPFRQEAAVRAAEEASGKAKVQLANVEKELAAAAERADAFVARARSEPSEHGSAATKPTLFLVDDFSRPRADLWSVHGGTWTHDGGRLLQKHVEEKTQALRSVAEHPRDVTAEVRVRITGGARWKSVGMSFDRDAAGNYHSIYLSAYAGGPKLQVSHHVDGGRNYPASGMRSYPVKIGQPLTLRVDIRDRLLNAYVDGELRLAYELPRARQSGRFELWTFDATAEFDAVRVEGLPASVTLVEASADGETRPLDPPAALEKAKYDVELARHRLETAEQRLQTVRARIAADNARHARSPSTGAEALAREAATAERRTAVREAEAGVIEAKYALRTHGGVESGTRAAREAREKLTKATAKLEAAQEALEKTAPSYTPLGEVYPATSSGRRLALARWIASRENPLAARVAVNHVWLRHFGEGLVPTVFDFGISGKPPTHRELLDWLAVELVDGDWNLKRIHRHIVTSTAYRMASSATTIDHPNGAIDADNRYLWRRNSRRLESEAVRDSVLSVSGQLDLSIGGPELDQELGLSTYRRSLYYRHAHEKYMSFLKLFDGPSVFECYRRDETIVPQQALALSNSALALEQSRRLAKELWSELGAANDGPTRSAFVLGAFERVLGRPPTGEESLTCTEFLRAQGELLSRGEELTKFSSGAAVGVAPASEPHLRARENLVHVLMNHHEFVTIR